MQKQINGLNENLETETDYGFYSGLDPALQDKSDWQTIEVMAQRKACIGSTNCLMIVYESGVSKFDGLPSCLLPEYALFP